MARFTFATAWPAPMALTKQVMVRVHDVNCEKRHH